MSEDDDLKINTLHRFDKHSPGLVLQEYSHCEVPAGCGGVVIRWLAPAGGAPAVVHLLALGATADVSLDGRRLETSWIQLTPGPHVIAAHLRATAEPAIRIFTISVVLAAADTDDEIDVLGRGDPRWRIATAEPEPAWTAPGFADHAWSVPAFAEPELLARIPDDHWIVEAAARRGAALYELPAGEAWVRVAFVAAEGAP